MTPFTKGFLTGAFIMTALFILLLRETGVKDPCFHGGSL